MNAHDRDTIFKIFDLQCLDMCKGKSIDYASDKDVLDNFKRNAERAGLTSFQIWLVYFSKHIDSITNAVKNTPDNPTCATEPIEGRIVDALVYLKLFACLLEDNKPKTIDMNLKKFFEDNTPEVISKPSSKLDEDVPF